MNEIETRADKKDGEAMAILHEVETIKGIEAHGTEVNPVAEVHVEGSKSEAGSSININVNDATPEGDRKVRDSSFDSKSEDKNKKKSDKDSKEKSEDHNNENKKENQSKKENEDESSVKKKSSDNPEDHAN